MTPTRNLLVLARRDAVEAARVAAGLTLPGHRVRLVFMTTARNALAAHGEMLALTGITPETTLAPAGDGLARLDAAALAAAVDEADHVLSL